MHPIKRVVLNVIDKKVGFIEGMEVDFKEETETFDVSIDGDTTGSFSVKDFEDFVIGLDAFKGLNKKIN